MAAHIRTVIINSDRPDDLVRFWSTLLELDVSDTGAGITWLRPDSPGGVGIGIQHVAEKTTGHTEVHVDVAVDDLDATEELITSLGGRLVKRNVLPNGFEWRVVADSDGHEFCVFVE